MTDTVDTSMTAFMITVADPIPTFVRAETKGDSLVLTEFQLINNVITVIDTIYKKTIPKVMGMVALGISIWGSRTSEDAIATALIPP